MITITIVMAARMLLPILAALAAGLAGGGLVPSARRTGARTEEARRRTFDRSSRGSFLSSSPLPPPPPSSAASPLPRRGPEARSSLDRCSVSLVEPSTGCEVVIVGCFHGAPSSSLDVEAALLGGTSIDGADLSGPLQDASSTRAPLADVVVLELCPERFRAIQDQRAREGAEDGAEDETVERAGSADGSWRPRPQRRAARQETGARDWAAEGVEGLLRLAGRAQSAFFPGLRPGSEFAAAARCAAGADLVLADAPVRDTLRELSRLGSRGGGRPPPGPLEETRDLAFAVLGVRPGPAPGPLAGRFRPVSLCEFAARSPQARAELVRWLVAPLLAFVAAAQAISFLILQASAVASGGDGPGALEAAAAAAAASPRGDAGGSAAAAAASAVGAALACHLGLVLPAARVVLWERDACLARGIRAACRRAAAEAAAASRWSRADPPPEGAGDEGGGRRGRVVAVLGLLHVNGVAERLVAPSDGEEESQGRGT